MNDFLFELGSEEIPAWMIGPALDQLRQLLEDFLEESRLEHDPVQVFDSPRRLVLLVENLPDSQPVRLEQVLGPPRRVALDENGKFTKAGFGFARKSGVEPQELEVFETEKGEYLGFQQKQGGLPVPELLKAALPDLVSRVHWPKTMYWQESRFRFVRPIRWLVALWNDQVLPLEIAGIRAGRCTQGHRYLGEKEVPIPAPGQYVDRLRKQFVLVDLEERRQKIRAELARATPPGMRLLEDPALLSQVERLNEYPQVLAGTFDRRFLEIPREVLITVMRHHQKYFAVADPEESLAPAFLTVINTARDSDTVRTGHQRVLRARLEDADFFWKKDRSVPLEERVQQLGQVVFQRQLGSYADKTERIAHICARLSRSPTLQTAARLCKVDLTSEMVFELPELQGIMGGLQARAEDYPEAVWKAIYEHYQPASLEDSVPTQENGALLSIADKLDTLVGCFGIGITPTGSSDPFALRRQAQGVIKILLEHELPFSLPELIGWAQENFSEQKAKEEVREQLLDFFDQRIRYILGEEGLPYDVLNAVLARGLDRVVRLAEKARALQRMRFDADFEALAVAFKRIRNILTKAETKDLKLQSSLLREPEERVLREHLERIRPAVEGALAKSDYELALRNIASFREPVDRFFDTVLVMDPDESLRNNRLALLEQITQLFLQLADISEVVRKD